MPEIRELEAHVADLVAAGEVVERAASVVKELVENAIDAGSSAVVVEIRRGGMSLIRVTDNGCGIPPEQLPTAFLRHATSKIQTVEDLGAIGTLGFRGEALAAVAAVSRVDILTRTKHAVMGAALHLEGGVPGPVEPAGAPEGTAITVQDLFFNTPARLKFMKKDSAEAAAINGLLQHLALSRPDISFRLIRDGVDILHTPGDGKLDSTIYAALGRDFARSLTPISGRGGSVAISGFITKPSMNRRSRGMQIFFVNGRFVKSQLLTAALEEGYRNQLIKGQFPGCVVSVDLPLSLVDVNVHPAKTVVKFAQEKEVFHALYYTVLDTLGHQEIPRALSDSDQPAELAVNPRRDFFQSMDAKQFRERSAEAPRSVQGWTRSNSPQQIVQTPRDAPCKAAPSPALPVDPESPLEFSTAPPAIPNDEGFPVQTTLDTDEPPWRISGEILHTYIVCESSDECIYLIDKHAAHERINFDRLKAMEEPPVRQMLIQPIAADLRLEDAVLLLENLPLLQSFGFSCEDFGDGTVLIREVPADISAGDAAAILEEFAGKLRTSRSPEERRDALLHTVACKAAIKGGWTSTLAELRVLVEKVQSGEIHCCPHGRPVAIKFTKHDLEKLFKR